MAKLVDIILPYVGERFLGQELRGRRERLLDDQRLSNLGARQRAQIVLNYSHRPNSLLDHLCDFHGSDKGGFPEHRNPYPWLSHSYTDFLSLLFEPWREEVNLVFECGIGTNDLSIPANMSATGVPGASLRVWRDFFPNAQIVGADIDKKVLFQEERIETFVVDQADPRSVRQMWKKIGKSGFQLMIDDGLHTFRAGSTLFLESIDRLAPDGTYIIEDVQQDDMFRYMDFFRGFDLRVDFVTLRRPPHNGNYVAIQDNQLVVVRRARARSLFLGHA